MSRYADQASYINDVRARSRLPRGFRCGTTSLTFVPPEMGGQTPMQMNMAAILLDEVCEGFAAVTTRNRFCGHPVTIARKRLARAQTGAAAYSGVGVGRRGQTGGAAGAGTRGVLINNKVANVCTAGGEEDAEALLGAWADRCNCRGDELFSASTGVIGWKLPVDQMRAALPDLQTSLQSDTALPVAQAIMTTDSFPKVRSVPLGDGRLVGVAKGAGMIEPNMATLLVFLMTDCRVDRPVLQGALSRVMDATFNRISVDGDQSTSDIALLLSSGAAGAVSADELERALQAVCGPLSHDVVRNGEGTRHVVSVDVVGAPDAGTAMGTAKAVVNSPLVKTAVCGNDPNVGRIVGAIGDYLGNEGIDVDVSRTVVSIGGVAVFSHGRFALDGEAETAVRAHLEAAALDPSAGYPQHENTVDIRIDLASGAASGNAIGSDLTHEYVSENADYRS